MQLDPPRNMADKMTRVPSPLKARYNHEKFHPRDPHEAVGITIVLLSE